MKAAFADWKDIKAPLLFLAAVLLTGRFLVLPHFSSWKGSAVQEIELLTETPYETRAWVNDSGVEGPTVVVVAGIHGNEPAGILAAEQMIERMPARGKLVLIPRANQPAIADQVRHPISMQDLNRSFPGKNPGTTTEEAAFAIHEMITQQQPSLVLDLHESFGRIGTHPLALGQSLIVNHPEGMADFIMSLMDAVNRSTAASDPFTWEYPPLKGTLAAELREVEIQAVTVETDMGLPLRQREAMHLEVIYQTMEILGMMPLGQPDKGVE